jgi:hypothetical protein
VRTLATAGAVLLPLVPLACGGRLYGDADLDATSRDGSAARLDSEELLNGPSGTDEPGAESSHPSGSADATETVFYEDAARNDVQASSPDATLSQASESLSCDAAVPECVTYFQALGACFHMDLLESACQPALIPDGSDQLAQIESLCQVQLQNIQTACR